MKRDKCNKQSALSVLDYFFRKPQNKLMCVIPANCYKPTCLLFVDTICRGKKESLSTRHLFLIINFEGSEFSGSEFSRSEFSGSEFSMS